MRIHVFSVSSWYEPHRLRQQISQLLSENYEVHYHSPGFRGGHRNTGQSQPVSLGTFWFITKFSSLPLVSILNAFFLFCYMKSVVRKGDVVFNFLPVMSLIPRTKSVKQISVINDDFASMAPKATAWWIRKMLSWMAARSDVALYVSTKLMAKYKCSQQVLFHPWADKAEHDAAGTTKRTTILYWGYLSTAIDYDMIEGMATQIEGSSLDLDLLLVGPLNPAIANRVNQLVEAHECLSILPPRALGDIDVDRVLFGIEMISPDYRYSDYIEFPNKGPRLLAYGIPLVYSGCKLLGHEFFVRYNGDVAETARHIRNNKSAMAAAINRYFVENNSSARLKLLDQVIRGYCLR